MNPTQQDRNRTFATKTRRHVEFRSLAPGWEAALAGLFRALAEGGDARRFHPHPLTADEARARCGHRGKDLYCIAVEGQTVVGYGMLRGWDAGYDVPSLGIAVHPAARGRGVGRRFMRFLHDAARKRGAKRVRLRVHADNLPAVKLYESLGYRFSGEEEGLRVGLLDF